MFISGSMWEGFWFKIFDLDVMMLVYFEVIWDKLFFYFENVLVLLLLFYGLESLLGYGLL